MQKQRSVMCAIVMTLLWGVFSVASAGPNFGGEWKMNSVKSNFAPLPAPDAMVRKISQHDSHLKIVTIQSGQQQEITTELSYTTDGKACKNKIRGQDVTGTARWDGDKLVIESQREVQGMHLSQRETWTLSEGGQTLTIANHVQTPQGAFDITIVLEKQPAS